MVFQLFRFIEEEPGGDFLLKENFEVFIAYAFVSNTGTLQNIFVFCGFPHLNIGWAPNVNRLIHVCSHLEDASLDKTPTDQIFETKKILKTALSTEDVFYLSLQ